MVSNSYSARHVIVRGPTAKQYEFLYSLIVDHYTLIMDILTHVGSSIVQLSNKKNHFDACNSKDFHHTNGHLFQFRSPEASFMNFLF